MEEVKINEKKKKDTPYDRANIVSELLYCWLLPYFVKGYKQELTEDDMFNHRKRDDSGKLGDLLENEWNKQALKTKSPSLMKILLKIFSIELFLYSSFVFMSEIIKLSQPLIISKLMRLFRTIEIEDSKNEIYLYCLLLIIANFVNIIFTHFYNLRMAQIGMKMKIACSAFIYRKTLKLNQCVLVETTIGKMVNLLSNDVGRFELAFHHLHHLWLGPIMMVVVFYLTYQSYGWTGMSGIILLVGCMPLQMYLGKKNSQFRFSTAVRTDERVRLMNEIINGIQVIKMYTWEKPFAKVVTLARMIEVKYIKRTATIKGFLMSMSLSNNRASIAIAIITYVATGNILTSTYVYTITSFYRILNVFVMFFPQAISIAAEVKTSIYRIQSFLLLEDKKEGQLNKSFTAEQTGGEVNKAFIEDITASKEKKLKFLSDNTQNYPGFKIQNVSAKWVKSHTEMNLENISLSVNAEDLIAVIGPVGSGKSSLLQVLLQELEPLEGYSQVNGSVSYASQQPWLFGGTVKQNIIFGQPYDEKKYNEVIKVCALQRDLTLLPYGDKTRIGERGTMLSGGQRARVNLARAVYKDADIYLLDDPLSAVDTHVGKHLFEECICNYLSNKCVILITHQLQYLKNLNNIVLLDEGKIKASGNYSDIRNSNNVFTKLLKDLEKEEEKDENEKGNEKNAKLDDINIDEVPDLKKEEKGVGKVSFRVYKSAILAGGNLFKAFLVLVGFFLSQILDSGSEYFVTIWVNREQASHHPTISPTSFNHTNDYLHMTTEMVPLASKETQWTSDWFPQKSPMYIYTALVILLIVITVARAVYFYLWCLSSSSTMHNKMFDNIIYSPMLFFQTNPSGRILNRFSKDIGIMDEVLPTTILDTLQIGLNVLAICLVIGSLSFWIILPTLIVLVIFYLTKVVYLETSRDIKRIEAVTRSPVYSHLTASLQGLTTIRAFKAQDLLAAEFDKLQNLHSAAFFTYLGASRTLGFWLDFYCLVYVALILVALLFAKGETLGGNIGLALTQAMSLTGMFQWGIRQWSELENQMTSVERIQEYTDLTPEVEGDVSDPPKSWPERGQIVFNKLSLRYSITLPYVLKNVSFIVNPQEKIGVVGRTGAGKSSLTQALFRLTFIEGSIIIDGIDTKTIPLNKLRSAISIIPQEPVLFSGKLRGNLDPFDEYPDEVLWNALEEVELKSAILDLPDGLDNKMSEGGNNFSVGQRQLLCLARAVIRRNKILVMDEATANVDLHTDGLIQKTIRKKFSDCTVITVAHRLHTIMDSDKVLVMDAGEVLEYDNPHRLLQNQNGTFYSLVQQTGSSTAKNLMEIAETAYKQREADKKSS